ncbi:MAG: class I SAM-dependent methyltransferase [Anaerolineales bacterium]|nr:class I SAM-dependent methyltransferase [Anaerolineales bacterium]
MKIEYKETSEDLQKRIDIHEKYGSRDIDEWMLDLLKPQKGERILDAGCGAGKQCRAFYEYTKGGARITGGDVSDELLGKAEELNRSLGGSLTLLKLDFNQPFELDANVFDLASCCFAIYYAEDIPFTISEMHRVLKSGGRLFTTGPMPENKKLFYDIIHEATGKLIPPMPGSSRYGSEILGAVRSRFANVEVHLFENPLVFDELQPFLDYTRASLSEDRLLWKNLFSEKDEFESVMDAIRRVAGEWLQESGKLTMTKVVGGFVATK